MSFRIIIPALCGALLLTACQSSEDDDSNGQHKILDTKQINRLIPARTSNRMAWANDVHAIMDELKIERNVNNTCAIVAVVDQESNFIADPTVPGLGKKAVREMNERLEKKLGKKMADVFDNMLEKSPSPDNNFLMQLEDVKTERELDQLYREIFVYYTKKYNVNLLTSAAKLLARQDLAENFNPVRTLGSMQVHIRYAVDHSRSGGNINKIRDDLYTQYGGLYYGIHRLMNYPANYNKPIYRFADFNSGMYSSRNAAFQQALSKLSGQKIDLDGDLLSYDKDGDALSDTTSTEKLLNQFVTDEHLALTSGKIRSDLLKEKSDDFEKTDTYQLVNQFYKNKFSKNPPYAIMPQVVISGPKLSRDYNTNWYANRVNQRYTRCINNGRRMGFREVKQS